MIQMSKKHTTMNIDEHVIDACKRERILMCRVAEQALKEKLFETNPDKYNFENGFEKKMLKIRADEARATAELFEEQLKTIDNNTKEVKKRVKKEKIGLDKIKAEEKKFILEGIKHHNERPTKYDHPSIYVGGRVAALKYKHNAKILHSKYLEWIGEVEDEIKRGKKK